MSDTNKTHNLSTEQIESINKIFDQFDKDNSDEINKVELNRLSLALNNELSNAELMDYFQIIDLNKSGSISREEFIKYFI